MNSATKTGYGSFVLAAAAYIVGVVLFSFWSFNAHHTALHDYVDRSLMNAAFATEEILNDSLLQAISENRTTQTPDIIQIQDQLDRIARHGKLGAVAAGHVKHNDISILISGSNEPDITDRDIDVSLPLSPDLKTKIISMVSAGQHDAGLITAHHPGNGAIRHAIIYKALDKTSGYLYITEQQQGHIKQQLANQMLRTTAAAIGMVALAIPLITLFSRTQRSVTQNLTQMNSRLQNEMDHQKNREAELKEAISDLERFNAVSAGRETRIIELKSEVNDLLEQMNRNKRYNIDKID